MLKTRQVSSEPVTSDEVTTAPAVRTVMPTWSPAQIVGLVVGIGSAVLGAAALSQTGFDTGHIYTPHQLVWSFPHSPLLGVLEIGFGALVVLGSVIPGGSRAVLGFLGTISLAFGIVVVVQSLPNRLNLWLAVSHRNGWLYVIAGAVLLVSAVFSPIFFGGATRDRVVRRTTAEY
jgi:hypothetical protein